MPKALGIAYTKEGKGRDIVLLHGWGASKESFYYTSSFLKKNFTVTAIDFSGFGESDKLSKPYTVFDYMTKLDDFLNYLDINPYAIIAHSFGGRVAIKYCALNHFKGKLILCSSAGLKPKRGIKYYSKVYTYKLLKKITFIDQEKLRKRFASNDYKELSPIMQQTFKNVVNEDLSEYLRDIVCETLLVWGENDNDTPLYMAKEFNKRIKNSYIVTVKDAGHFAFVDKPNTFNSIINSFL